MQVSDVYECVREVFRSDNECRNMRREKSGKAMGYLAHVQSSRIIHNALMAHPDNQRASNMYVVICRDTTLPVYHKRTGAAGGVGNDKANDDIVAELCCGEVVRVSEHHRNGWMKLCAPVVGWAQRYVTDNRPASVRGASNSGYRLQLCQVSRLSHARHGSVRPHGEDV